MQKYCKNQNNINILLDHESGRGFKVTFTINEEGESNILVITRAPKSHNAEDLKKHKNEAKFKKSCKNFFYSYKKSCFYDFSVVI